MIRGYCMEIKRFVFILTVILLLSQSVGINAEGERKNTKENKNYYIRETEEGGQEFVQRLSWEPIKSILYYDVLLERMTDGRKATKKIAAADESDSDNAEFEEFLHFQTTETFLETTMPAGKYRWRISVCNLLGKIKVSSDWTYFEVLKAYRPEITLISPSIIYLEEKNDGIFTLTGKNLFQESRFVLQRSGSGDRQTGEIKKMGDTGRKADILVDIDALDSGSYFFHVANPGGFAAEAGPITVRFKKMIDFDVSVGYALPVSLYEQIFPTYLNTYVFPRSFAARLTFIPFKRKIGYFGFGLSAAYSRVDSKFDAYSIDGNMTNLFGNFVYQRPLIKQRLMFEAHGGVGSFIFSNIRYHFANGINSVPLNTINIALDAGAAVQFYVLKRLYLDVCLDYAHAFLKDVQQGLLFPSVSVGWQF